MAKHNKTGRSANKERHIAIPYSILDSRGYIATTPLERAVYNEVLRLYNGTNNGSIGVSSISVAERCSVDRRTISRALVGLVNCGLLRRTKASSYSQKRLAAEYRLTHRRCDKTNSPPTHDYLHYSVELSDRSG